MESESEQRVCSVLRLTLSFCLAPFPSLFSSILADNRRSLISDAIANGEDEGCPFIVGNVATGNCSNFFLIMLYPSAVTQLRQHLPPGVKATNVTQYSCHDISARKGTERIESEWMKSDCIPYGLFFALLRRPRLDGGPPIEMRLKCMLLLQHVFSRRLGIVTSDMYGTVSECSQPDRVTNGIHSSRIMRCIVQIDMIIHLL